MNYKCKLIEKSFHDKETNEERKYYALVFDLADGSTLDITIKGDKAKLLRLSSNVIDKDIWEN